MLLIFVVVDRLLFELIQVRILLLVLLMISRVLFLIFCWFRVVRWWCRVVLVKCCKLVLRLECIGWLVCLSSLWVRCGVNCFLFFGWGLCKLLFSVWVVKLFRFVYLLVWFIFFSKLQVCWMISVGVVFGEWRRVVVRVDLCLFKLCGYLLNNWWFIVLIFCNLLWKLIRFRQVLMIWCLFQKFFRCNVVVDCEILLKIECCLCGLFLLISLVSCIVKVLVFCFWLFQKLFYVVLLVVCQLMFLCLRKCLFFEMIIVWISVGEILLYGVQVRCCIVLLRCKWCSGWLLWVSSVVLEVV